MHYHAEVWIPDGEKPGPYVAKVMEPHREWFSETDDSFGGFWDWYQIGGRWTGEHDPEYDPETDPRNIEECFICNGTGFRRDDVGRDARRKDPTYTCNGCGTYDSDSKAWGHGPHGPGKTTKWPTSWARYAGDIKPVSEIPDELTCYTLIIGETVLHQKEWTGEEFRETGFDGNVKAALAAHGIKSGSIVTVDYHS